MNDHTAYFRDVASRKGLGMLHDIPGHQLELAIKLLTERKEAFDPESAAARERRWAEALKREVTEDESPWLDEVRSPRAALLSTLAEMVEAHEASAEKARAEAKSFLGRMKRRGWRVWKSGRP